MEGTCKPVYRQQVLVERYVYDYNTGEMYEIACGETSVKLSLVN